MELPRIVLILNTKNRLINAQLYLSALFVVVGTCCASCSPHVNFSNGYSIKEMSSVEHRLVDPLNRVIGSNVEKYYFFEPSMLVGVMTDRFLTADQDLSEPSGFFLLDVDTGSFDSGLTSSEVRIRAKSLPVNFETKFHTLLLD